MHITGDSEVLDAGSIPYSGIELAGWFSSPFSGDRHPRPDDENTVLKMMHDFDDSFSLCTSASPLLAIGVTRLFPNERYYRNLLGK